MSSFISQLRRGPIAVPFVAALSLAVSAPVEARSLVGAPTSTSPAGASGASYNAPGSQTASAATAAAAQAAQAAAVARRAQDSLVRSTAAFQSLAAAQLAAHQAALANPANIIIGADGTTTDGLGAGLLNPLGGVPAAKSSSAIQVIDLGNTGKNQLVLSNGGSVTLPSGTAGTDQVTVSGSGSVTTAAGTVSTTAGSLTTTTGGTLAATSGGTISLTAGSGTLSAATSATISSSLGGTVTLPAGGGTMTLSANVPMTVPAGSTVAFTGSGAATVTVSGAGTVQLAGAGTLALANPVAGTGGTISTNSGTTSFTSGATASEAPGSTINLSGSGSIAFAGTGSDVLPVIVQPNAATQALPAFTTTGSVLSTTSYNLPPSWTLGTGGALSQSVDGTSGQTTVTITQTQSQALLNWTSFNIGKNTTLDFDQSAGGANVGSWIAVNRILDPSLAPSLILGSIVAPGQVYVINQNGIIFNGSSQINTHALVASTMPINDSLVSAGLLNNAAGQFLFNNNSVTVVSSDISSSTVTLSSAILPTGFGIGSTLLGSTVVGISGNVVTLAGTASNSDSNKPEIFSNNVSVVSSALGSNTVTVADPNSSLPAGFGVGSAFLGSTIQSVAPNGDGTDTVTLATNANVAASNQAEAYSSSGQLTVVASSTSSKTVTLASSTLPLGFGVGSSLLGSTVQSVNGNTVTLTGNAATADSNQNENFADTVTVKSSTAGSNTVILASSSLPPGFGVGSALLGSKVQGALPNLDGTETVTLAGHAATTDANQPEGYSVAGAILVQKGASLFSPGSAEGVGGKIALLAPTIDNEGTISSPDGQIIFAAGQQVGFSAHPNPDPSLRGLDVAIGLADGTESVTNGADGYIYAPEADVTMTAPTINQNGTIEGLTSVALNGRIDLLAVSGLAGDTLFSSFDTSGSGANPVGGTINLGPDSLTEILPDYASTDTQVGSSLALPSQIYVAGSTFHMEGDATSGAQMIAPNATVTMSLGILNTPIAASAGVAANTGPIPENTGLSSSGPVPATIPFVLATPGMAILDPNSNLDVSGSNVQASVTENILQAQLTQAVLENSPLQETGPLRGQKITVDISQTGTNADGSVWYGSPIGDLSGYANLVEHTVGELTIAGGNIAINTNGSVVANAGSTVNVSGGSINYQGANVQTTTVDTADGQVINISKATPNLTYLGIDNGSSVSSSKWGFTENFSDSLRSGIAFDPGYVTGGNGGSLAISTLSATLNGELDGNTTSGVRQQSTPPVSSTFNLTYQSLINGSNSDATNVVIQQAADPRLDPNAIYLSPDLFGADGFSNATINTLGVTAGQVTVASSSTGSTSVTLAQLPANFGVGTLLLGSKVVSIDGLNVTLAANANAADSNQVENFTSTSSITVAADALLTTAAGGSLNFTAENINVLGQVVVPSGTISFSALATDPFDQSQAVATSYDPTIGNITVQAGATVATTGLVFDEFSGATNPLPISVNGGTIALNGAVVSLASGSSVDVSAGAVRNQAGKVQSGNGGTIKLTGAFLYNSAVGQLIVPEGTVSAYGIGQGGTLKLATTGVQVGGDPAQAFAGTVTPLELPADFFGQGGFSSISVSGSTAVQILSSISPVLTKEIVAGGSSFGLGLVSAAQLPQVPAAPVNLTFSSGGVTGGAIGQVTLGSGVAITTGPTGAVSLSGQLVDVLGSITAPGGAITITGQSDVSLGIDQNGVLVPPDVTVYLGTDAQLSVSGETITTAVPFGYQVYHTGQVLKGGMISITGNIVGDVNGSLRADGAVGALDVAASSAGVSSNGFQVATNPYVHETVASNGGSITLNGLEELDYLGQLSAQPGNATAIGGTLTAGSGLPANFVQPPNAGYPELFLTPGVSVSGQPVTLGQAYSALPQTGGGFLAVSQIDAGEFGSLILNGNVEFKGGSSASPLTITASQKVEIIPDSLNGTIFADGTDEAIVINAPYIEIGATTLTFGNNSVQSNAPLYTSTPTGGVNVTTNTLNTSNNTFNSTVTNQTLVASPVPGLALPSYGGGATISLNASDLIDVGFLSLQGIGTTNLSVPTGDIRGGGLLYAAGNLNLTAGQVYTSTASTFTMAAFDATTGAGAFVPGTVDIEPGTVTRSLPLSAGGTINVYATDIIQNGTIEAPFGTINLGALPDASTGLTPVLADVIQAVDPTTQLFDTLPDYTNHAPVTQSLTLGGTSVTSVSGVSSTGQALELPYGTILNGGQWIAPNGADITAGGLPAKAVNLKAQNVTDQTGSLVDLAGGGDLFAYQFTPGVGGTNDVLSTFKYAAGAVVVSNSNLPVASNSFAILPGYNLDYAPIDLTVDSNVAFPYANASITGKVGSQIYLTGGDGLAAGTYTILPARYALLPGAYLVTPGGSAPTQPSINPDGSISMAAYSYDGLSPNQQGFNPVSGFQIASSAIVHTRAEYDIASANSFLSASAVVNNQPVPLLPMDAGQLVFSAAQSFELQDGARVVGNAAAGTNGLGSQVDISSPDNIEINDTGTDASFDGLVLDAATLTGIGADSLLIGGFRQTTATGTTVTVTTSQLVVNNTTAAPLTAGDVVLVSNGTLNVAATADIVSTGTNSAQSLSVANGGTGAVNVASSSTASNIVTLSSSSTLPSAFGLGTAFLGSTVQGIQQNGDGTTTVTLAGDASLTVTSPTFETYSGNVLGVAYSTPTSNVVTLTPTPLPTSFASGATLLGSTVQSINGLVITLASAAGSDFSQQSEPFSSNAGSGNVTVTSSSIDSNVVSLSSASLPSGFVVGSTLLGSTVQSINGTLITLAGNASANLGSHAEAWSGAAGGSGSITVSASNTGSNSVSLASTAIPSGFGVGSTFLGSTVTSISTGSNGTTVTLAGTADTTIAPGAAQAFSDAMAGNVTVAASASNSNVVTLSGVTLPAGFGVGTSFLGSTVTSINGISVTLSGNANASDSNQVSAYSNGASTGNVTIVSSSTGSNTVTLVPTVFPADLSAGSSSFLGSKIESITGYTVTLAANANATTISSATSAFTSSDGALLRINGDTSATTARNAGVSLTDLTPSIFVAAGATITGNALTIDSTSQAELDTAPTVNAVSVAAGRISVELDPNEVLQSNPGLVLSAATLASFQANAQALALSSYSSIDFYGTGTIGGAAVGGVYPVGNLTLDAADIRGFTTSGGTNAGGGDVVINAGKVTLNNVVNGVSPGAVAGITPSGSFQINAADLQLGPGAMLTNGFAATTLSAANAVTASGVGSLTVQGGLAIAAPLVAAVKPSSGATTAANFAFNAQGGALHLTGATQTGGTTAVTLALGSTISLSGASVTLASGVEAPSGTINVTATSGNVEVQAGGSLNVSGQAVAFGNATAYSNGGQVSLKSATGAVTIDANGLVNVSAQSAGGNAGTLSVSVPNGTFRVADGTLQASAGARGTGGAFNATLGSAPTLSGLTTPLTDGGFSSLAFDVLTGSVTVDGAVGPAVGQNGLASFSLTTEQGGITVQNTINASGVTGGTIGLYANQDVTLNPGAVLTVEAQQFNNAGKGGLVDIETRGAGANGIAIQAGSQINLAVDYLPVLLPESASNQAGASITLAQAGSFVLPSGTPGNDQLMVNSTGTITTPGGVSTIFDGTAPLTGVAAGSTIKFDNAGTVTFVAGGTGGTVPVWLSSSASFTTAGGATNTNGNAALTAATAGDAAGTLHLRAPTTSSNSNLAVVPFDVNSVVGASSVILEGYNVYNTSATGGQINAALEGNSSSAANDGSVYGDAKGFAANANTILGSLLGSPTAAQLAVYQVTPGTEIINPTGDLTLASNWDLSTFRFGPTGTTPGILTLRASGNLNFTGSLTDGFAFNSADTENVAASPYTWDLSAGPSWSYRLVAGAQFTAANASTVNFAAVQTPTQLGQVTSAQTGTLVQGGSLLLGKVIPVGTNFRTQTAVTAGTYAQLIRTGTGSITIDTGGSVDLLNQLASIYTAGSVAPSVPGFANPTNTSETSFETTVYGAVIYPDYVRNATTVVQYLPQYTEAGGDISIDAQQDISHLTLDATGALVADTSWQFPTNWLYRRGATASPGVFDQTKFVGRRVPTVAASTTWWVDFSNFFEGIGALGGGNVSVSAGNDIVNVDAVVPTNARMPATSDTAGSLVELGGGNLTVVAGNTIVGGSYYVEQGVGTITAGSISSATDTVRTSGFDRDQGFNTPLPLTLFVGDSSFSVNATNDLSIGSAVNPFLLPEGISNDFVNASIFSTYGPNSSVSLSSLLGSVSIQGTQFQNNPLPGSLLDAYFSNASPGGLTTSSFTTESNDNSETRPGDPTSARSAPGISGPWTLTQLPGDNPPPFFESVSNYETSFALSPPILKSVAFSGNIQYNSDLTLYPSASGTLQALAAGSVDGAFNSSVVSGGTGLATITILDDDPSKLPGITNPFGLGATTVESQASPNLPSLFSPNAANSVASIYQLVDQTPTYEDTISHEVLGIPALQAQHTAGLLHDNATPPVQIETIGGDIADFTLVSPENVNISSGLDLQDVGFYIQNNNANDVSTVTASRDISLYDPTSTRLEALNAPNSFYAASGDVQISGPGTLEVLAGRNLSLGQGIPADITNDPGTGLGITSIGNTRDPFLPFDGAGIIAAAGLGGNAGLGQSQLDYGNVSLSNGAVVPTNPLGYSASFIGQYLDPSTGASARYLPDLASLMNLPGSDSTQQIWTAFSQQTPAQQDALAIDIFYDVLRDAGRDHNSGTSPFAGSYSEGFGAISALFPTSGTYSGNISFTAREIKTTNVGDIDLLAPGGGVDLGVENPKTNPADQGLLTVDGGNISIFTNNDVSVGTLRIFTLHGGNIVIWSSAGNIDAGASSRTVQSAPPTRVLVDSASADVQTDLAGLATGGGIGVLETVVGAPPGDVDLIAPVGTVDAGDAGIRSSGNVNIAAARVLNAGNIQAGGSTSGVPSTSVPNISSSVAASNAAGSSQNAASAGAGRQPQPSDASQQDLPSIIYVEVIGYGGGDSASDDPQKDRKAAKATYVADRP